MFWTEEKKKQERIPPVNVLPSQEITQNLSRPTLRQRLATSIIDIWNHSKATSLLSGTTGITMSRESYNKAKKKKKKKKRTKRIAYTCAWNFLFFSTYSIGTVHLHNVTLRRYNTSSGIVFSPLFSEKRSCSQIWCFALLCVLSVCFQLDGPKTPFCIIRLLIHSPLRSENKTDRLLLCQASCTSSARVQSYMIWMRINYRKRNNLV